ncbi:MAG: 30S ribosomal protein S6 [Kiloniellales bacterium]
MPLYESVFIARQDISASQVDTLADQFTGLIQAGGGEVKKREYWGLRNLAYRIKKNRKGHYILFNIDAPPAAVAEMERNMSINEDVIRYLTVRVDELESEPSAMMRSRGSRDERGGRRPGGGRFHGDGGGPRGGRGPREDRGERRCSDSGSQQSSEGGSA